MSRDLPKVEKFEHIECESITVKNDDGASIRLSFDAAGYPEVGLSTPNEDVYQLSLKVNDNGGLVLISRSDGKICLTLSIDQNGCGRIAHGTHNRRWTIPNPDEQLQVY